MPRRPLAPPPHDADGQPDRVALARRTLLEGVGAEVAASFPGITRLGGQIVAALYLAEGPRSMDQLAAEIGCSKSNIFGNLRGLESAGIVERRREAGTRHDSYALKGPYPDVIIGAYIGRLRRVVAYRERLANHNDLRAHHLRQAFSRGLTDELARVNPGALLRLNSESAAALFPLDPRPTAPDLREQIEHLRQRVAARLDGMTVSAALGHLYPRVLDAPRAFREAQQALNIALRLYGPSRTTAFDDLGIYRLLFHLHGTPELSAFYDETVGKIVQHDVRHNSDLVPTLKAFFASHGNLSRTAEILFLHRNTVSYRQQRIEELSGLHLDDEEDRFRLQLALKLRDLV